MCVCFGGLGGFPLNNSVVQKYKLHHKHGSEMYVPFNLNTSAYNNHDSNNKDLHMSRQHLSLSCIV